jgi:hypothetical protein
VTSSNIFATTARGAWRVLERGGFAARATRCVYHGGCTRRAQLRVGISWHQRLWPGFCLSARLGPVSLDRPCLIDLASVLTSHFGCLVADGCVCLWGQKRAGRVACAERRVFSVPMAKNTTYHLPFRRERGVAGSVPVRSCVCVYDTGCVCQCSEERVARHLPSLRCSRHFFRKTSQML